MVSEEQVRRGDSQSVYSVANKATGITPNDPRSIPGIRGGEGDGPTRIDNLTGNFSNPRVAVIVDDVANVVSVGNNYLNDVFDVEQVEILRGPQSTARGSNAIDGALVVKTKDPSFDYEYELFSETTWNEFSQGNIRNAGLANIPLVEDQVATRLVVEYDDTDDPVRYRDLDGSLDPDKSATNITDFDTLSLRNKVLVEPAKIEELSVTSNFRYQKSYMSLGRGVGISDETVTGRPLGDRVVDVDSFLIVDTRAYAGTIDASYELTNDMVLRGMTSYQDDLLQLSPNSTSATEYHYAKSRQFVQDVVLELDGDTLPVTGVVGASYMNQVRNGALTFNVGQVIDGRADNRMQSAAVFADLTHEISERTRVNFGGRLQRVEVDTDLIITNRTFNIVQGTTNSNFDEKVFLPKLAFSADFAENHTLTASFRKGYNPGGGGIDTTTAQNAYTYKSEYSDTYELIYRGALNDNWLTISSTLYFNDYKNRQFQDNIGNGNQVVDIKESRSYGWEFESTYQLVDSWQFYGGFALASTKIVDVENEASRDLVGNEFNLAPHFSTNVGAIWEVVPNLGLNANAQYVGKHEGNVSNTESSEAGNYFLLDIGAA